MTGPIAAAAMSDIAEREHRERLLNSYLRERGDAAGPDREAARSMLPQAVLQELGEDGQEPFLLRLPATGAVIAGSFRWLSAMGHHKFGDRIWLREAEAGADADAIAPGRAGFRKLSGVRELASLLLGELTLASGGAADGDAAALMARIDSSVGNAGVYVEAAGSELPLLTETHGAERIRTAEQSMLLGHPFHPAPKSSSGFTAQDRANYAPELGASFVLHYFAVLPELVREQWLDEAVAPIEPRRVIDEARRRLPSRQHHYVLMPAHPWQAGYLLKRPEVQRLMEAGRLVHLGELGGRVYPTSSVRTVWDPAADHMLKLPLHVRITHFLRVNPGDQLERTMEASRVLAQLVREHPFGDAFQIMVEEGCRTLAPEAVPEASAAGEELAADFGVVYRRNPARAAADAVLTDRDSPMVVAALLETHACRPTAPLWDFIRLAAGERGAAADARFAHKWLERYAEISLVPLIWLFAKHGVSMEAHAQNALVALDRGWPAKFYVRDLEGTSISADREPRQTDLPALHPALYSEAEAWSRFEYYVLVNHFGHLVHTIAYALRTNELSLWRTVYETVRDSPLLQGEERCKADLFERPYWSAKANLTSALQRRGEHPAYVAIPNPLSAVSDASEARRSEDKVIARIAGDKRELPGTPYCVFLYDLGRLRQHASRLVDSLPPFCRLFYAMKANSEEPILKALAPIVHGFETASAGEIRKARAAGGELPVIYGGPVKTDADLDEALAQRVRHIHVESPLELRRLDRIAAQRGVVAPVLLRVNVGASLPDATLRMAGGQSQFGIDERLMPEMARLCRTLAHVRVEGFHLHSLSNNLSFEKHLELIAYYCGSARDWMRAFGLETAYLNAGGGIGVNYGDPAHQFEWDRFVRGLERRIAPLCSEGLTLVFECGRYVAASCGYYAAEVADVKSNHGSHYALLRGGTHHFRLPASWGHSHPFRVVPIEGWDYPFARPELADCRATLAGELCTPKDALARDCRIERIRVGDVILFPYAGAYGWAISHRDFLSHPYPQHVYLA